jgi:hypothetical protein
MIGRIIAMIPGGLLFIPDGIVIPHITIRHTPIITMIIFMIHMVIIATMKLRNVRLTGVDRVQPVVQQQTGKRKIFSQVITGL